VVLSAQISVPWAGFSVLSALVAVPSALRPDR